MYIYIYIYIYIHTHTYSYTLQPTALYLVYLRLSLNFSTNTQYRSKFLLKFLQPINLNVNCYLLRYDKCNFELPINRISKVHIAVWTWGYCAIWIPIFVSGKFSCSTLTPLPLLISNTMSLPNFKFENNFYP